MEDTGCVQDEASSRHDMKEWRANSADEIP